MPVRGGSSSFAQSGSNLSFGWHTVDSDGKCNTWDARRRLPLDFEDVEAAPGKGKSSRLKALDYELRSNPSMDSTASAHTEASDVPDLLARKGIYAFAYVGTVPRLCDGYRRFRRCIRTVRAHGQRCLCYRFHCYSRSWRRAIRAVEENFLTLPSPTVSPPFSSVGVVLS